MVQMAHSWDAIDWLLTVQVLAPPVTALLATVGLFISARALFLNARAIKTSTETRELDIFYKVFQHIQDLQDKYYRDYSHLPPEKHRDWLSMFYNALECMAFLIRQEQIKGRFLEFYRKTFISSYEDIFWKHASGSDKTDGETFKEMKALYKELTGNTEPKSTGATSP
jgi:hypothetical protein